LKRSVELNSIQTPKQMHFHWKCFRQKVRNIIFR